MHAAAAQAFVAVVVVALAFLAIGENLVRLGDLAELLLAFLLVALEVVGVELQGAAAIGALDLIPAGGSLDT